MALVHKKISKSKRIQLTLLFVLVIGITFGVLYFGILRKPSAPKKDDSDKKSYIKQDVIPGKSGFEQIQDLASNSIFKKLRSFGEWPLSLEPKGRSQPFIKAQTQEDNKNE